MIMAGAAGAGIALHIPNDDGNKPLPIIEKPSVQQELEASAENQEHIIPLHRKPTPMDIPNSHNPDGKQEVIEESPDGKRSIELLSPEEVEELIRESVPFFPKNNGFEQLENRAAA